MGPVIHDYPYCDDELAEPPLRRPKSWRRGWTALSLLCGLGAAALALLPVGPVGAVIGGAGIAAGALALLRGGRVFAVTGTVISSLAVAVTLLMTIAELPGPGNPAHAPPAAVSTNVEKVLADELTVEFGSFTSNSLWPEVGVTLTNKLDVVRQCKIEVGAFDGPRAQLNSARVNQESSPYDGVVLDAHATAEATAEFMVGYDDRAAQSYQSAAFRVISVACGPFDY
ncbi:hypothetical protein [Mycobacterium talmoniae]|uniref:DUF4190 domain-containing protein n=1 Tax=Mycobacterium talmoniae TaxID=1858794 RepID=A0A1S1NSJ9_9MYCO|nr:MULTISPECIES: hypothetical protein [Mycobacterium]OHV06053.1 hypothetical protein BKN37_03620 [Mycobacterium talmoniae]PQM44475.1 hypothetical protein C1Y40_05363 [Mycobacterium talmoniae]TDH49913.1 hypothetical protein E2F47_19190 [Mycobacterium eburneum]